LPEQWRLQVDDPSRRGPAGATYTILFTVSANGPYSVHVCNTLPTIQTYRIALVEAGYTLPGDNTPGLHHFIEYERAIEAYDSWDTPSFGMDVGERIIVYGSAVGINFLANGPAFS
jgi:hypothetical protein